VRVLAADLIEETLGEFERTRQPEVLAHTSLTFAQVTGGRYQRLHQADDRDDLLIFDAAGAKKGTAELSRGTAEQLYLCLRLGLVSEFQSHGPSLPLVMDDVLVNFDPARARAMAEALVSFSRGNQVLFFTCHPGFRDLFRELEASVRVVEMAASGAAGDALAERRS
jgi:uncharacterized protein YhaN